MMWSNTYNSKAREVYTRMIQEMIPQVRDELRGIAKTVDTTIESTPIKLPTSSDPCLPEEIHSLVCNAGESLKGYSFDLSAAQRLSDKPIEIEADGEFRKLIFLHTTANNAKRVAWNSLTKVGEYVIRYSDNTELAIPVEYGGNICVWSRRYAKPMTQQYYRHQGYIATYLSDPLIQAKSKDGRDITVLAYDWVNPYPDRKIESISCRGDNETDADILLLGISGVR